MKKLLTVLLLLVTIITNAQDTGIAMDLSVGIANTGYGIGRFGVGAVTTFPMNTYLHSSINLQVFSNSRKSDVPVMPELREGVMLDTWELYGGIAYHFASYDKNINNTNGFKPAFGIQKRFRNTPFTISTGMSGKYYSIQFGVFGIR